MHPRGSTSALALPLAERAVAEVRHTYSARPVTMTRSH